MLISILLLLAVFMVFFVFVLSMIKTLEPKPHVK